MKGIISTVFFVVIVSLVYSQEVPFDQLNLTGSALYAATKIKERFPNVVFTSGTRTLDSQARAVAQNIYRLQDSGWVSATYRDSAFIRKLNQEIINNWASIKGNESIILQTVKRVFDNDNAGAKLMSKHLIGYAFDLRVNCVNYDELNSFVKTLPGFNQFLTREGGLAVWHIEFNEAQIPSNNFQATHKVVTNDGSGLRLRNASGINATVIGSLANGSLVKVLNTGASWVDNEGNRGNWTYISTQDGRIGWCFGAYLQSISVNNNTSQPKIFNNIRNSSDGLNGTKWEQVIVNGGIGLNSVHKRVLEFSNSQARMIYYYHDGSIEESGRYECKYENHLNRWELQLINNRFNITPCYVSVINNVLHFSNNFGTDEYKRKE